MKEYFGIDVAKWQGNINWSKVKKAGVELAILKITQKNNSVESSFERNYAGCKTYDIPVGCYRYVYAKTVLQAQQEAKAIVSILKKREMPCGIWLDMEDSSLLKLSKSMLSAIIEAERKILEAAGYKVGIYCNQYWYNSVLPSYNINLPWWIAKYGINDGKKQTPPKIRDKQALYGWQYTSKGKINGISGSVDLNAIYIAPTSQFNKTTNTSNNILPLLKYGARGNDVKKLQQLLNKFNYQLQVDGIWGDKTDFAVKDFQKKMNLTIDGIVGPLTWNKLLI